MFSHSNFSSIFPGGLADPICLYVRAPMGHNQRALQAKLPHQNYFMTNDNKTDYDERLMSEPAVAYVTSFCYFLLPTCLGISYSTA